MTVPVAIICRHVSSRVAICCENIEYDRMNTFRASIVVVIYIQFDLFRNFSTLY